MPRIEGAGLVLREFEPDDAGLLESMARSERVYRYLPTFLHELQYDDKRLAIERMRAECFETAASILLAVCTAEDPATAMGIAEIYNYQPDRRRASIGCRLDEPYWRHGVAPRVAELLADYLLGSTDVETVTAHIMVENGASSHAIEKCGFVLEDEHLVEDWGHEAPVTALKYVKHRLD